MKFTCERDTKFPNRNLDNVRTDCSSECKVSSIFLSYTHK